MRGRAAFRLAFSEVVVDVVEMPTIVSGAYSTFPVGVDKWSESR